MSHTPTFSLPTPEQILTPLVEERIRAIVRDELASATAQPRAEPRRVCRTCSHSLTFAPAQRRPSGADPVMLTCPKCGEVNVFHA